MKNVPHFLDSAYATLSAPGDHDRWVKYDYLANFYIFYQRNIPTARSYLDSMFMCLKGREKTYPDDYATTLYRQGEVNMADKQYSQAYKSYFSGKQFVQKYLDTCDYSKFSSKLGFVEYNQGKYMDAIPHFKQALSEYQHCLSIGSNDFNNLFILPQSDLNSIALCFERSGQLDSAIYYYQEALQFIKTNALKFPQRKKFAETAAGVVYGNLGGTYAKTGNLAAAEFYLKENIRINDQPGYAVEDAQTAKIKLIRLYLDNHRFPEANDLLTRMGSDLDAGKGLGIMGDNIKVQWLQLKWRYLDKTGDLNGAYLYSQRYYRIRDSLNDINTGLKEADLDAGIREAGQQYQIALLHKNNQLKTSYLSAAVIFSVLTILILFLLWKNLRRSNKNVKELTALNRQVEEKNRDTLQTLKALEQSHQENTRIMKVVAHDLRNPVGAITALCELMLQETRYNEEDRGMLEMIRSAGQSSLHLISDLLHYTVQYELKKEPVELNELMHYCVDMMQLSAAEKQQHIELQTTHITISINREKIWRVFSNLISNAIKFSPNNTLIGISTTTGSDHVIITVKDQGIGIPAEIKNKIFDLFTEAKRPGTGGERPYGMGLAIARQIVEAHGGAIWFESLPGDGTAFYVKLPLN
ncbi:tetratricopeptide repeat-containing sensor histidine kinase [Chitinophaga sp.]|uniref:tetratricopeptide repeat-containing sensor histidine kinase n=1 Tax=Chitinophaga sp. TaxID=1869181 RepID=UPI002BAD4D9D|nr:tetratricopeptide repeat-containing sensor histidine kinase [Chitinophaga sp.]HWV66378.1 tetratricopeptide repeat-containing sensor histidine kinase [Chitinophaga sp.]